MSKISFIYCSFYKWSERVNGKNYPHAFSASIMMSFILMLLIGVLFSVASYFYNFESLSPSFWKVVSVLTAVGIFLLVHSYFAASGRYVEFLRAYDSSGSKFRNKPGRLVALLLAGSLSLLFLTWAALFRLAG